MGPRAGLDSVARRKIPVTTGNRTPGWVNFEIGLGFRKTRKEIGT